MGEDYAEQVKPVMLLKREMKKRHWDRYEVGVRAGVDQYEAYILRLLFKENRDITEESAKILSRAFGMSVKELLMLQQQYDSYVNSSSGTVRSSAAVNSTSSSESSFG